MQTMPKTSHATRLLLALALLLTALLAGCESDDPTTPTGDVNAQTAAALAAGVQGPAAAGAVMTDLEMFQNPLSSLSGDAGVFEDTPMDQGWTDEGVDDSYPAKMLAAAGASRRLADLRRDGLALAVDRDGPLHRLSARARLDGAKAAGDTLAVEYFNGENDIGLNALIETDTPDVLRLVSIHEHPQAALLQIAQRSSEIVFDSMGNLDPEDDALHSISHEFTRANGEHAQGELAPVSGSGAIGPDTPVRAFQRVDDPSFHVLQEWVEAEMVLLPGDLDTDGDESVASMAVTVHWRSGAEQSLTLAPVADQYIGDSTDVRAVGLFTARPDNAWLESRADTLVVRLGDLDDEADDLLYSASRAAVFDGTASDGGHPRSWVRLTPDAPIAPGEEPCGGEAIEDVYYPAQWWIVHLTRTADLECDGSGVLTAMFEFRDGTSASRTVTWDGEGGATVQETRPDGTVVDGEFDESTGAFSVLTTFPTGHDPVSRHRHGTATEATVTAWDETEWLDEHLDRTYLTATTADGVTIASGYREDGAVREDFTLSHSENGDAAGEWERNDGATGEFALEMLEGGGSHLTFSAADPNADGSPSLSGEIWYAPDGSGTGTITYTQNGVTVTFPVTIDPDGTGSIDDGEGGTFLL
ncbi:MAG TPA: hypothetical protein P5571_08490 [Candidatus Krumholzibacteria bacterium]|nr:hypothetical protein [Candidatus Krumholzibacteria bacterium]